MSTNLSDNELSVMGSRLELPEPLIRVIQTTAAAEHLTPEQFMQKLVDKHLENKRWQELLERGHRQSEALGYTEDDVDRLIHEHRGEKRQSTR
ncbi:MAG: hypothetical protein WB992_05800 [Bryobacteraceae bacterium]